MSLFLGKVCSNIMEFEEFEGLYKDLSLKDRRFQCVMGDGREWNLIELPLIKTDPVFAVTSKSPQSKINPKEYNWFYSILSK